LHWHHLANCTSTTTQRPPRRIIYDADARNWSALSVSSLSTMSTVSVTTSRKHYERDHVARLLSGRTCHYSVQRPRTNLDGCCLRCHPSRRHHSTCCRARCLKDAGLAILSLQTGKFLPSCKLAQIPPLLNKAALHLIVLANK